MGKSHFPQSHPLLELFSSVKSNQQSFQVNTEATIVRIFFNSIHLISTLNSTAQYPNRNAVGAFWAGRIVPYVYPVPLTFRA
jgi:hypothetical protein